MSLSTPAYAATAIVPDNDVVSAGGVPEDVFGAVLPPPHADKIPVISTKIAVRMANSDLVAYLHRENCAAKMKHFDITADTLKKYEYKLNRPNTYGCYDRRKILNNIINILARSNNPCYRKT